MLCGAPRLSTLLLLALGLAAALGMPHASAAQSSPSLEGAGACCLGAGDCELLTPNDCAARGGSYRGDGTTCEEPQCAIALTPVIGVNPPMLGFGLLCPGDCRDGVITLRNAVNDPESQLIVSELVANQPFSLVDPPATPFTIPGDGTEVPLTIRFCPTSSGPQIGALIVSATNALNSPLVAPLNGFGDPAAHCVPGGPYFSYLGQPIVFNAGGSSDPGGGIVSYAWDFGDGSTAAGPVASHTYNAFGTYTVQLALIDDCGSASSCLTTASVVENLPPICDAGGPYTGEAGSPINMSGAGSSDPDGTIVVYRWDFGNGQTATGVTPSPVYAVMGDYTVTLTVIDNGAASSTCTTIAHVLPPSEPNTPPICDAGGPYEGLVGQSITFDGTGSSDPDGSIEDYQWEFGDCGTGVGPTPTHAYSTAGIYTAVLCVADNDGGTSCCSASVTIQGGPPLRAGVFSGKQAAGLQPMGANPMISLPLHAVPGCQGCGPLAVNCREVNPTVNIPGNGLFSIYLLAANHSALAAVQTAFAWHSSWELLGAIFDCLPGQLTVVTPVPPGGATAGTVATAFNCVTSGQVVVIGRLLMRAGATGCLSQVQSSYPNGIHAIDCSLGMDLIPDFQPFRLGKICVAQGGVDACAPLIPVQSSTWGQIKASYR